MDQQTENDKTERATGLSRRTREEIAKWNRMTALRFQTGGRHQTSPASLRGAIRENGIRRLDDLPLHPLLLSKLREKKKKTNNNTNNNKAIRTLIFNTQSTAPVISGRNNGAGYIMAKKTRRLYQGETTAPVISWRKKHAGHIRAKQRRRLNHGEKNTPVISGRTTTQVISWRKNHAGDISAKRKSLCLND